MKVYELINLLTEMPAGANVEISTAMTLAEFAQCEIVDNVDGADIYSVTAKVTEAVAVDNSIVCLYS